MNRSMCGICGQFNYVDQEPVSNLTIERMTKSIVHRGPDDEGYFLSGPLGFGFRRLSIIDLAGGHQPMSDQGKNVWVIFNGEIYNFKELRSELESRGHVFQTNSDTEVIIHGYKQWGTDVFNRLYGMFGLAIWDTIKRKLIIARDPMGIKLVYYKNDDNSLYFGSEIRPILAAIPTTPEIDPVSMNLFLCYRYTPSPLTLFKGIFKLAPGTMLVVENGKSRVERWYRYRPVGFTEKISDARAKDELLALYQSAVKRHLISDVPVGLLLSGGLDSGLLLALMNNYGNHWRTYTIGYGKDFRDDELKAAEDTARYFASNHVSIKIDRNTFEESFKKIISVLEEPVAASSIVPMYFVCQRARRDVKVVLMGQGPDELFGGYPRHLGVRYGNLWRKVPQWLQKPFMSLINSMPRNETLKRGAYSLNISERMKRYQHVFSILPGETVDELFYDGVLPNGANERILEYWADFGDLLDWTDELGGFQYIEIRSSLPDELLMYADKLSMAHGLEVRVPYLDREIVEYVERLPGHFKIRYGSRKFLHRQLCKEMFTSEMIKRRKIGFGGSEIDSWFREATSRFMNDMLLDNDSLIYKWLRKDSIKKIYMEHRNGKQDNHKILFSALVLEEWLRTNAGKQSFPARS